MQSRLIAGGLSACLALCFALTFSSCHKDSVIPAANTPLELPDGSNTVINGANQFSVDVFQRVLQTEAPGINNLISPLSIYFALDMTYNGAAGRTADSMAAALQLSNITKARLNSVNHALLQQMPKEDTRVQLSIANSIWYNSRGPQPTAAFQDTVTKNYLATSQGLDFSNPASLNTINSWVAKNTNNKIPTILSSLDPTTLMILVNAIYFDGSWMHGFKTSDTKDAAFHLQNGNSVTVPFMNQTTTLRVYHAPSFTLAELPYGTGKAYNMYLAIPTDPTQPVNTFAASLDSTTLNKAMTGLDSQNVQLSIPKWQYSYTINNMAPELTSMGMGIAFTRAADFTNMFPPNTSAMISQVIHKTYIQVSEDGTVAAAVTGVVVVTTAFPTTPVIKADHPFVYFITEKQTGMILFIGVVNDPSQH